MAHKNTAKRVQALRVLLALTRKDHSKHESQSLYDTLEGMSYHWNSSEGVWKEGPPPSTSIFKDDEGNATGLLRVRLMGMTEDAQQFILAFRTPGWSLIETSDPYPNRKGPGYRWYLTFKKDGV